MVALMPIRITQRRNPEDDIALYSDATVAGRTDDDVHTLKFPEPDHALRGEDYPALVRVWDNDADAAIYDTD